MHTDNEAALKLSRNPKIHGRSKHIEIKHHFIRQIVTKGKINTLRVTSKDNTADILTKPLAKEDFSRHVIRLGMTGNTCDSESINNCDTGLSVGELF
jgi:hypothetical protein